MEDANKAKLAAICLDDKVIKTLLQNAKLVTRLASMIEIAGGKATKPQGQFLYKLSAILPPTQDKYTKSFVDNIMQDKWVKELQITEGIEYVKQQLTAKGDQYVIDQAEFDRVSGVGINVTDKEIEALVAQGFEHYKAEIAEQEWAFQFNKIIGFVNEQNKWADGKVTFQKLKDAQLARLGERPKKGEGEKKRDGKNKAKPEEKKKKEEAKKGEDAPAASTGKDIMDLMGRDCAIGANTAAHIKAHEAFTGGKMLTRFPPEPNGYLHIGHAKAIRFNFTVAAENGGKTYLRFDDTNPCKENHEFIDHITKNVAWLGYKPWKVTASSDYFQELHDLAVGLIKQGKAYVCHQAAAEMSASRNAKTDSPYRTRSVEENLKLFAHMREGRFDEGECCLRVKMDMQHANPCLRDFVAYRIRFTDHPMTGDAWCIYPTYDYTHCIVDSLENITHSLCTLEFEIRRESYFRLLQDCELYKPIVWEYSRLNITNTVLSKRKIEALVNGGHCEGWNDPRLLTLEGLRHRGYTAKMINDFCEHIGVSRKGNENLTSIKLLEGFARQELDANASRTFGVMDPILLEIVNLQDAAETKVKAPLFPREPERGSQTYTLTKNVYIEREDFSETHVPKFFGLTPDQKVMLKYGPVVQLKSVEKNADGSISHVKVEIVPNCEEKLKGVLHWVSKENSLSVTCNLYGLHFLIEDIKKAEDKWLDHINPDSLVVKSQAKVWNLQKNAKIDSRYQFERVGYFVLAEASDTKKGKFIYNRIVELKESKDKAANKGKK